MVSGKYRINYPNRSLRAQVKANILKKDKDLGPLNLGPGKPSLNDARNRSLSGPKSAYSTNQYVLVLRNILAKMGPRAIVYAELLHSRMVERYFKVSEYAKMVNLRDTGPEDYMRAIRVKGPFEEEWLTSFKAECEREYHMIMGKDRNELMSIASMRAKKNLQKLSWQDSLYTNFFTLGGLAY